MKLALVLSVLTGTLLLYLCGTASSAVENLIDLGKQMYEEGHFEQAKKYLQAEISANPKSSTAHYMLGNVYLALKQDSQAKKEYLIAEQLDPKGASGRYSKSALEYIDHGQSAISGIEKGQVVKNSAVTISQETTGLEQQDQLKCNAEVQKIFGAADAKTKQLEDEMQEQIKANGEAVYERTPVWAGCIWRSMAGQMTKVYDPEPANEEIRQKYNSQIDLIKAQARQDADKIIAWYKNRDAAAEDSALTMDKSYVNKNKTANVELSPVDTNMYVRNYQTNQNVSGDSVPIMAAPPKLMPGAQLIHKVAN